MLEANGKTLWEAKGRPIWELQGRYPLGGRKYDLGGGGYPLGHHKSVFFIGFPEGTKLTLRLEGKGNTLWEAPGSSTWEAKRSK